MSDTLVLGANGYLGLHVVDALRAEGVEPLCGRRARANVLGLLSRKVKMIVADLERPETLADAMRGVRTVVHIAGHYPRHSLDRVATLALGERQARAVVDAAQGAGVERLVYVSSTATVAPRVGLASNEDDQYGSPPGLGVYHDLKWTMEQIFCASGLDVRVALPSGCVGPGDLRMGTSALLVALARGLDPEHADGWVPQVDPRDAAVGIARMAVRDVAPARVILSATSGRLQPMLEALARHYGVARPSPALPAAEALRRAEEAERAAEATRTRARMSREIVELTVYGTPLDNTLSRAVLGLNYRPFTETVADFDRWATRLGFLPNPAEVHPHGHAS